MTEHDVEMIRERLEQFGVPQPPRSDGKPSSATLSQLKAFEPVAGRVAPRRARSMTKTEEEFQRILIASHPNDLIYFQPLKFRIGVPQDRCFYTPDFMLIDRVSKHMTAFEVKGPYIWEDSTIKFKSARAQYPFIDWQMHQRQRNGTWTQIR